MKTIAIVVLAAVVILAGAIGVKSAFVKAAGTEDAAVVVEATTAEAVEDTVEDTIEAPVEDATVPVTVSTTSRPSTTRRAVNNDGLSVDVKYSASVVYIERNAQQAAAEASKEADAAAQELDTTAPADNTSANVVVGEISNDAPQVGVTGGSAAQEATEDAAENAAETTNPASNGEEEIDNADFESADFNF